ncbi:unnamed protein product [Callosobruchus maculatus]|uniref:Uncharacterized protein n=1 Tax=Callosobruchus maculatus TaxID=64391 RepID=A0A653CF08_CALMS|nr:unnamed protein product [Callosobruchus maculatus]
MFDLKMYSILVLAVVSANAAIPEMSINSSSVPNAKYEVEAIKALTEAYITHPDNIYDISRTFSQLYEAIYPSADGWKVFFGCTHYSYYNSRNFIYIAINVKFYNNITNIVTVFN